MKDISKMAGILGLIVGVVAWVHAEVTIPKLLTSTAEQVRTEVDRHATKTHAGALTQREFQLWAEMREKQTDSVAEQIIRRLDAIEAELRK